ncbi:MAG: hypothetical protein M3P43_01505 [Actinomycetota bacterium]|nr:hypothetical protein [Actinomycetota bacterium]
MMPRSKTRRSKHAAPRKRRDRGRDRRARETQAAQHVAEARKISPSAYRRRRILGWSLVTFAVVMAVQHYVHHLGAFTLISPGADDLFAGYPLAAALGVVGAIVLTK